VASDDGLDPFGSHLYHQIFAVGHVAGEEGVAETALVGRDHSPVPRLSRGGQLQQGHAAVLHHVLVAVETVVQLEIVQRSDFSPAVG
jgi:hypothetical protein